MALYKRVSGVLQYVRDPDVWPKACVVAVVLLSVVTHTWNLHVAPDFFRDEAGAIETAKGLWQHGTMTRYCLGLSYLDHAKGVVFFWLTARAFDLFGFGVWQARLVTALAGVGITYLLICFGRQVIDWRAGVLAGLFHATSYHMLRPERWCKENTLSAMFMLAAALLILYSLQKKQPVLGLFAGLAAGLSLVTKISYAFIVPGLGLFLVLLVFVKVKQRALVFAVLGLFILGILIPTGGWLLYYNHWINHEALSVDRGAFDHLTTHTGRASRFTLTMFNFAEAGTDINAYQHRIVWAGLRFFLWDKFKFLGVLGFLLLLIRGEKRTEIWFILLLIAAGFVTYWVFDGKIYYYHPACTLLYVGAGALVARIWDVSARAGEIRYAISLGIALVCVAGLSLCISFSLILQNHLIDPYLWGPILSAEDAVNIRAAEWAKENIAASAMCYGADDVLSLTPNDYIPSGFYDYAEVYREFEPSYYVLNEQIHRKIEAGEVSDPSATMQLEEIAQFSGRERRCWIYRIEGLKSQKTVLTPKIQDFLREYPQARPSDFTPAMLEPEAVQ